MCSCICVYIFVCIYVYIYIHIYMQKINEMKIWLLAKIKNVDRPLGRLIREKMRRFKLLKSRIKKREHYHQPYTRVKRIL